MYSYTTARAIQKERYRPRARRRPRSWVRQLLRGRSAGGTRFRLAESGATAPPVGRPLGELPR